MLLEISLTSFRELVILIVDNIVVVEDLEDANDDSPVVVICHTTTIVTFSRQVCNSVNRQILVMNHIIIK